MEAGAILICIWFWFSAPLGVLIAEWIRRRRSSTAAQETSPSPAIA